LTGSYPFAHEELIEAGSALFDDICLRAQRVGQVDAAELESLVERLKKMFGGDDSVQVAIKGGDLGPAPGSPVGSR
jgi:hypothetical protein